MTGVRRPPHLKERLERRLIWPLLDARDWVTGRKARKAHRAHMPSRFTRAQWAALDAWDVASARPRRALAHVHARRFVPVAAIVVPILGLGILVGAATLGGGDSNQADVVAGAPPPRVEVKGASATSEDEARERAAENASGRPRAASAPRNDASARPTAAVPPGASAPPTAAPPRAAAPANAAHAREPAAVPRPPRPRPRRPRRRRRPRPARHPRPARPGRARRRARPPEAEAEAEAEVEAAVAAARRSPRQACNSTTRGKSHSR